MISKFLFYIVVSTILSFGAEAETKKEATPEDRIYEDRKEADADRRTVLDRSNDRYKRACKEKGDDHGCFDQCREIYPRYGDRNDCAELSVAQIDKLLNLHESIEDPDHFDLAEFDFEDLDVYLNISIAPLDKLIRRYRLSEAKEFMLWLVENDDIARIFEKEDDEYDTLETLLKKISGSYSGNDIYKPFITKINGDKLMELAIDNFNEEILEWFQYYINEKNSACKDNEVSVECFKVYCKIGKELGVGYRDDWLGFESFEEYIDDIIRGGINSKNPIAEYDEHYWSDNPNNVLEDIGDIDDWVDNLCTSGAVDLTK